MKHGFPTASCVARLSERAGATRRFRGKTDKGEDINRSLGVDPGASWRADFSRNGCRRRQLPSFRDFASTRLALAEDPNMMPTRVEFPTAVQHLTTALFLSRPVEPLLFSVVNAFRG